MESPKFDSHSIAALKRQWRQYMKKLRLHLSAERREQAGKEACLQLSQRCGDASFVLSFASFGSEIDLWPFNQELANEGRLVLPRIVQSEGMQLYQVTHFNQLEPHRWGMLEPKISECSPVELSLIEIALIPGLGFDLQTKYRLGYGKGYYDRLLASSGSTKTWGIGFLEQAVTNLPQSNEDVPLKEIYLF
jgi:5-formyltetrahydrofolate cyclo-ligase